MAFTVDGNGSIIIAVHLVEIRFVSGSPGFRTTTFFISVDKLLPGQETIIVVLEISEFIENGK